MKVIMTASRNNLTTTENAERNGQLRFIVQQRLGITGQPVEGFWKGQPERSYIFHGVNPDGLELLEALAVDYEQDAILVVRNDCRAMLYSYDKVWSEWGCDDLGDWQKVSAHVAKMFDGYTVTRDGQHYVACTRDARIAAERRSLSLMSLVQLEAVAYA